MSRNAIVDFWAGQTGSRKPLTPEQLAAIKAAFDVAGEVRPIAIAPGYAVSDDGRVFSGVPCSWHKDCPRELRQTPVKHGYLMVHLHANKRAVSTQTHALVAQAFLPPPAEGQDRVLHWDGNPANNRAGNLRWGTQAENLADAARHGRTLRGIKSPNAKLDDDKVRLARAMCKEGHTAVAVAQLLGVSPGIIRLIRDGKRWRHVE
jgi:hypothetical protein